MAEYDNSWTQPVPATGYPGSSGNGSGGRPATTTGYPAPSTSYPAPSTGYPAPSTDDAGGPLPPDSGVSSGARLPDSANKQFMRGYVKNVIDGENPPRGRDYFATNFFNHDPAPGEQPGIAGVEAFISSIFSAFSGFRTNINEQIAMGDLVVGRWTQTFKQTGSYLGFPVSGVQVLIGGITITRVRNNRIVEEWEARDAAGLLQQVGVAPRLVLEGGDGMTSAVTDVVNRYFYDVWNAGNLELIDEVVASNFVNHIRLDGQRPGRDGVKQLMQRFKVAFPDLSVSVDLMVNEGDRVATRFTVRGTHRDAFLGIPATGKPVDFSAIYIFRVASNQLVEGWGYLDTATLLMQLGALNFPSAGEPYPGPQPGGNGGTPGPSWPPATPPPVVTPGSNEDVARRWFDAVNTGDDAAVLALVSPDVIDHSGLSQPHGRGCEGHRQLVRQLRSAIPDWRSQIESVTVDNDLVTIRHTGRGTLQRGYGNIAGGSKQPVDFEMVSTVRVRNGKIVEHWANSGPFGAKSAVSAPSASPEALKAIAQRWFDAINRGDVETLDELVDYNVVDHSGLSAIHGHGCHGHKQLIRELRSAIPDWRSQIKSMTVDGDTVTIRHAGTGTAPAELAGIASSDGTRGRVDFELVSTVRIANGKITEHWASKGPFGSKHESVSAA